MSQPSLLNAIKSCFDKRQGGGRFGLLLLERAVIECAVNRNSDPLAVFLKRSKEGAQEHKVRKIIRAAFGDNITYKADSKHPTGGSFTLKFKGAYDLKSSNHWGLIRKAIEEGRSWDDKVFQTELTKELPSVEKKQRAVTPESTTKAAKHVAAYITARVDEKFDPKELILQAIAELGGLSAFGLQPVPRKPVETPAPVVEINAVEPDPVAKPRAKASKPAPIKVRKTA